MEKSSITKFSMYLVRYLAQGKAKLVVEFQGKNFKKVEFFDAKTKKKYDFKV